MAAKTQKGQMEARVCRVGGTAPRPWAAHDSFPRHIAGSRLEVGQLGYQEHRLWRPLLLHSPCRDAFTAEQHSTQPTKIFETQNKKGCF